MSRTTILRKVAIPEFFLEIPIFLKGLNSLGSIRIDLHSPPGKNSMIKYRLDAS
jgi:hypothetical protein